LNSLFFVRRCPPHPTPRYFLVLYLSPSKYTIMEGLRELTKIMATTNDTVVETQFVRCVASLSLPRIHFNTYGVLCKCLPRSPGCWWLTSTELQFLQVCESPSPPRGPPSLFFFHFGGRASVLHVHTLSSGLTVILLVFKIVDDDEEKEEQPRGGGREIG
jgi:hypothetical protein